MSDHNQLMADALAALEKKMSRDGLPTFHDPMMSVVHAALRLSDDISETLLAYWLDRDLRLLGVEEIAKGARDQALFSRDYLARRALASGADSCVLIHNHPSGEAGPSGADIEAADRVDRQLAAIGILVNGHFTVTGLGFGNIRTGAVTLFRDLLTSADDQPKAEGPRCPHCQGPLEATA
jgi:DNA repair protein RadC